MKFRTKAPPDINTMPQRINADIRRSLSIRLGVALEQVQRYILETPVYTGRTLANYRWSLGDPITVTRGPIKRPELPGKTSEMPLGEEPRRAANAALVEAEFRGVFRSLAANPYQKVYLRNNVPNFSDIEYGTYGADARTPAGGMTRRGELAIRMIIKGVRKVE